MKFMEKAKRFFTLSAQHEGFTLVELIVVIAILAILAGVAIPAYSGYIKKSQEAADQTLLSAVNKAFAAAAFENGVDAVTQPDGSYRISIVGGKVAAVSHFDEQFDFYYAGNEDATFKVFEALTFKGGVFVPTESAYAGLTFNDNDVIALKGSVFGGMGVEVLLNTVDGAVSNVAGLIDSNANIAALVAGQGGYDALARVYGVEVGSDEFNEVMGNVFAQKMEALKKQYPDKSNEEIEQMAENQIFANNAILSAANTQFDTNAFMNNLKSGDAYSVISDNLAADPDTALAQTAMAYAMYAAYQTKYYPDQPLSDDILEVKNVLISEEFKTYMEDPQAQKDFDGYQGAMNMITESSTDTDAVTDILVNGFSNDSLLTLMQGVTAGA